eukprot:9468355-Pyramimonas_sp.AAC.2
MRANDVAWPSPADTCTRCHLTHIFTVDGALPVGTAQNGTLRGSGPLGMGASSSFGTSQHFWPLAKPATSTSTADVGTLGPVPTDVVMGTNFSPCLGMSPAAVTDTI